MLGNVSIYRLLLGAALAVGSVPLSVASVQVSAPGTEATTVLSGLSGEVEAAAQQLDEHAGGDENSAALVAFYQARNHQPLWVTTTGLSLRGRKLMLMLMDAHQLGLHQPNLQQLMADMQRQRVSMAAAELELSWRVLSVGQLLTTGPQSAGDKKITAAARRYANEMLLAEISAFDEPAQLLRSWEPRHPDYAGLKQALGQYRKFAATPWGKVRFRKRSIRPGYNGPEVVALRDRLRAEGYLLEASKSTRYDEELLGQVQEFQRRHGLVSKGVVGKATLAALNVSAQRRLQQIEHSMARLFALPSNLGQQYVWVNIPAYSMAVYEDHYSVLAMDVIVGKAKHATPEFADVIEFIELNPYWNVPVSIAREEIIPKLDSDPAWLSRNKMDVLHWHNQRAYSKPVDWQAAVSDKNLPFRLRQRPGKKNPLGQVKFLFPNKYAVYMHDTPAKSLFRRNKRAFSHGCVRLAEPMKLAEYLFDKNFDGDVSIPRKLRRGKTERYQLDKSLPVYLSYSTAWVDSENRLRFSEDIYDRDNRQPKLVTQQLSRQRQQLHSVQLALRQVPACKSCVASAER